MSALSPSALKAAMLEKLHRSLLTEKHAKLLHIQPCTESQAAALGVVPPWAGFKIPYFTPDGRLVKDFYRYRFWPESRPSAGWASIAEPSKLRYVQPKGSELHVYMPPLLMRGKATWREAMSDPTADLHVTEGELKAACACANADVVMLGLGGVFSWMSKKHGQALLPILKAFKWKDRKVYLAFDSDRNGNPLVQLALSRLALALLGEGAEVLDVELPPAEDGAKQGVDDYMASAGAGAYAALTAAAKPVRASAELHRLNDEVAVVWTGGAAGSIVRMADGQLVTAQQFTRVFYKDRVYMEYAVNSKGDVGPPRLKYAAEEWLAWQHRTRVRSLTYAPGRPAVTPAGEFNIWRDTGVAPRRGDLRPWDDLLRRMFPPAGADPGHLLWFKRWLAYPLRFPGAKLFNCVLMWSHTGGTGKNLLAEAMMPVYGDGNCVVIKSRHLLSDFNGWAEGKQFVIGDEITLDDKRHTSGDLKSMLTNKTIRINRKGIEAYEVPDCANYYLTSNDPVALVLDQGERRTFVHHVPEEPLGDAYGRAFARWAREEGGAAAIAWHLLEELDMGDFSPTAPPPDTDAKLELIANSRSDVDTWAAALRVDPARALGRADAKYAAGGGGGERRLFSVYTPDDLLRIYDPEDRKRASVRSVGIAMDRAGFKKARHNNGRLGNVRSTFWLVGTDKDMSSVDAARLYASERPAAFVPPSQRGAPPAKKPN